MNEDTIVPFSALDRKIIPVCGEIKFIQDPDPDPAKDHPFPSSKRVEVKHPLSLAKI